jgi:hypothetical protein
MQAAGGWEPPTPPRAGGPENPGWGQPPPTQQWQQPPAGPPPGPPPPTQQGGGGGWRNPWLFVVLAVVLAAGAALAVVLATGEEEAKGQTVRFQSPTSRGPDPFTRPADVKGDDRVRVGSGPFGGTGSDLVCDRELLIRSLRAQPDRLREWARVVGVTPTPRAVARYIRTLRPVTLTVDTRVTNHSFVDGRAVAFQSILQAGTAVLVDPKTGRPVVRCRCGNPLLEPVYIPEAICIACPRGYTPPPPCDDYDKCWRRYPDPPPVCCQEPTRTTPPPEPQAAPPPATQPRGTPTAIFYPRVGSPEDTYTIEFSGFPPNEPVNIHLTRPDGVEEDYAASTDSSGRGSYTFPNTGQSTVRGTYNADVTNGPVIASAQTTVRDSPSSSGDVGGGGTPPPEGSELQCDPPRSQLESEQCAEQGR